MPVIKARGGKLSINSNNFINEFDNFFFSIELFGIIFLYKAWKQYISLREGKPQVVWLKENWIQQV